MQQINYSTDGNNNTHDKCLLYVSWCVELSGLVRCNSKSHFIIVSSCPSNPGFRRVVPSLVLEENSGVLMALWVS